jgi:hypothetical protein
MAPRYIHKNGKSYIDKRTLPKKNKPKRKKK